MAKNPKEGAAPASTSAAGESVAKPPKQASMVKARVLRECSFGKCDDVVTLDADLVASLHGTVDAEPAAVEYAEALAAAKN